jgi:hypothetical protein
LTHQSSNAGRLVPAASLCYTDQKVIVPLVGLGDEWLIPGSFAINPQSPGEKILYTNANILLDTGANLFDLPAPAFDYFGKRMEAIGHPVTYQPPNLPIVTDCSNIEIFPTIHIVFGLPVDGITITLIPEQYLSLNPSSKDTCKVLFRRITSPTIVLGVSILSRFAIEFNASDRTVGLCRI